MAAEGKRTCRRLNDLHLASGAPLPVDRFSAVGGFHPRAKADLLGALFVADFVGIMHRVGSFVGFV
jgi:hypothetical protein